MAKYTVEVGTLIKSGFDLGLRDYPIYEEAHRAALNAKILNHYYFREIGFETAELFKVCLNRRLAEIMPYYNKLYESETFTFDPLTDFSEVEILDKDTSEIAAYFTANTNSNNTKNANAGANKSAGKNSGDDWTVHSDTPQGNLMYSPGDLTYATDTNYGENSNRAETPAKYNAADITETATNSQGSSAADREAAEDYTRTRRGKSASKTYPELIKQYRDIILNIDMLIIRELADLFMSIY